MPEGLEIDLCDGSAWVSVVAFTMEKIRPRILPHFEPISTFDEINVRTYVKHGNKNGVYFLSIEASKRLSCAIAKGISQLPYRYSAINRTGNVYNSFNPVTGDRLDLRFSIEDAVTNKTELDLWLTERYALYQNIGKKLASYEIHHKEWELKRLLLRELNLNYPAFAQLISGAPDLLHYSEGVQVIAWGREILNVI